jgi:hypothetical protein
MAVFANPTRNASSMSFNHASDLFYPFVQSVESAENRRFTAFFEQGA